MRFSGNSLVQSSLFLALATTAYASSVPRATTCNGHAELCSQTYGNVTFVGAHDSYAVGAGNIAANQDYDITQQLNDGVRLLQSQAHNSSGVIELCHTSCALLDGGSLESYLTKVKTWMDANPNDVVTLLIVNIDGFAPPAFDSVFKAAGLDTLSYSPTASFLPQTGWPTLGSMISNNTRLVTFLDTGADFTQVPYLIDEFTNIWETAFDVTDTTFDCNVNRTHGTSSSQMFLVNHFLDKVLFGAPVPNVAAANVTNAVSGTGSLGAQVATCVAAQGRSPNFMLVDFYEYGGGSVFEVAASINGVTYSPATPIATPITGTATSSGSGSAVSGTSVPLNGASNLPVHWGTVYAIVISGITGVFFLV